MKARTFDDRRPVTPTPIIDEDAIPVEIPSEIFAEVMKPETASVARSRVEVAEMHPLFAELVLMREQRKGGSR